jgi:hypothetical protein
MKPSIDLDKLSIDSAQILEKVNLEQERMDTLIESIVKLCVTHSCLWADAEFPADDSSLYNDPLKQPVYANGIIEWKRPHEIF